MNKINIFFLLYLICSISIISPITKGKLKTNSNSKVISQNKNKNSKNKIKNLEKNKSKIISTLSQSIDPDNLKIDISNYKNEIKILNSEIEFLTNQKTLSQNLKTQNSNSIPDFISQDASLKSNFDSDSAKLFEDISSNYDAAISLSKSKISELTILISNLENQNKNKISFENTDYFQQGIKYNTLNENLLKTNQISTTTFTTSSSSDSNSDSSALSGLRTAKHAAKMTGSCISGILAALQPNFCAKKGSDFGVIPTKCIDGWTRFGNFCYKNCKEGMDLVIGVCWEKCKRSYKDIGIGCYKPLSFYFKKSYVSKSATNFDPEATCDKGRYKSGALCYRDCNNIGLVNCGIGYCAQDSTSCSLGILDMAADVSYGLAKLCAFALTFGVSSPGAAAVEATKKSLTTAVIDKIKLIFNGIKKSLKETFFQNTLKQNASIFAGKLIRNGILPAAIAGTCYSIAKEIAEKADKATQPGFDFSLLDASGITSAVDNCENVTTKNDQLNCSAAIINSVSVVDPTGLLSIASAFIKPECDVPSIPEKLEPNSGCIRFYEEIDFQGSYRDECFSNSSILYYGKTQSIKISDNVTATLYTGSNYTGTAVTLEAGYYIPDLSGWSINNLRSFKVYHISPASRCAVFYEECNFTGNSFQACGSLSEIPYSIKISSVKTSIGVALQLYSNIEYNGTTNLINSNSNNSCLSTISFDNLTKSIKFVPFTKDGCINFYSDCNFSGTKWEVCQNNSDYSTNGSKISSITVGLGVQVNLFTAISYQGNSLDMNETVIECLNSNVYYKIYNDKIKSLYINNLTPRDGCIVVFEECDFKGKAKEICSSIEKIYLPDNKTFFSISSIKIGKNVDRIILSSVEKYTGDSMTISGNNEGITLINCLRESSFDNKIKSIIVIPSVDQGCVKIYPYPYFIGTVSTICYNKKDFNYPLSLVPNTINNNSSLLIGENTQISFYSGKSQTGTLLGTYNGPSVYYNTPTDLTLNLINSLRTFYFEPKDGCFHLYPAENFEGALSEFCSNIPDTGISSTSIPSFKSIKIGSGFTKINFFSEVNYTGTTISFEEDSNFSTVSQLGITDPKNQFKSIMAVPKPDDYCINFYTECGYKGKIYTHCSSPDSFLEGTQIVSLVTGYGIQVNLHSYSVGIRYILENREDIQCITNSFKNNISRFDYIRVFPIDNSVNFFEKTNYSGFIQNWKYSFSSSSSIMSASVRSNSLTKVTLYSSSKYTGNKVTLNSIADSNNQIPVLGNFSMKNKVYSVKIEPYKADDNCIMFYKGCNYSDDIETICASSASIRLSALVNSYIISSKIIAIVYDNINYSGTATVLTEERNNCLSSSGINKNIKSVKIYPLPDDNCVTIYTSCDFAGTKRQFCYKGTLPGISSSNMQTIAVSGTLLGVEIVFNFTMTFTFPSKSTFTSREYPFIQGGSFNSCIFKNLYSFITPSVEAFRIIPKPKEGCIIIAVPDFSKFTVEHCDSIPNLTTFVEEKIQNYYENFNSTGKYSIALGKGVQIAMYSEESYAKESSVTFFSEGIVDSIKTSENQKLKIPQTIYTNYITNVSERVSYVVKSIELESDIDDFNCIFAYEECNYLGKRKRICQDVSELTAISLSKISSIKTGLLTKISLFSSINFSGDKLDLARRADYSCLVISPTKPSNVINSIKYENYNTTEKCIYLFSEYYYKGEEFKTCVSNANNLNFPFTPRSLVVGNGATAQLFDGENYFSMISEIAQNTRISCLADLGFDETNKNLKSIIIK